MEAAEKGWSEDLRQSGWTGNTHWSVVIAAGRGSANESAQALEKLCRAYWYPLYAYVRRKGYPVSEAQDLTQEFFARLLRSQLLAHANPHKGRFRSYLLGSLEHFLANEWRRQHAAKRGGDEPVLSLDDDAEERYDHEPADLLTPEKLYDRRWALSIFEQALERLEQSYASSSKGELFRCLREFLCGDPEIGDYERVGNHLKLSNGAVAAAVYRLRRRYRELVREEVAQTLSQPGDLEEELRSLLAALKS